MPTRERAPLGSPCWTDLWTSDVEGTRAFYRDLFGWEAQEPSPEFEGYFMFTREGVPVAGAMGDVGGMPATNTWRVYLDTDDIVATVAGAAAAGAEIVAAGIAVADLGTQALLVDPTGAQLGAWQAGTFPGFTVLNEPGAPSWFELHTRDHGAAVAFYRSVFGWETNVVGDSDEFRYATMREPGGEGELAGIMDAAGFLPRACRRTGRCTGRSMMSTPRWRRSKPWAARWSSTPGTLPMAAWPWRPTPPAPSSICAGPTTRRDFVRGELWDRPEVRD